MMTFFTIFNTTFFYFLQYCVYLQYLFMFESSWRRFQLVFCRNRQKLYKKSFIMSNNEKRIRRVLKKTMLKINNSCFSFRKFDVFSAVVIKSGQVLVSPFIQRGTKTFSINKRRSSNRQTFENVSISFEAHPRHNLYIHPLHIHIRQDLLRVSKSGPSERPKD